MNCTDLQRRRERGTIVSGPCLPIRVCVKQKECLHESIVPEEFETTFRGMGEILRVYRAERQNKNCKRKNVVGVEKQSARMHNLKPPENGTFKRLQLMQLNHCSIKHPSNHCDSLLRSRQRTFDLLVPRSRMDVTTKKPKISSGDLNEDALTGMWDTLRAATKPDHDLSISQDRSLDDLTVRANRAGKEKTKSDTSCPQQSIWTAICGCCT